MKYAAIPLVLFASFCAQEPVVTETMDQREPIGVLYVGAPELPVRKEPNDTAEVIATYQNSEAVSILAEKGDWVEVRSGLGSGWARKADLTSAEATEAQEADPQPKFRIMPLPVTAPSARGEIYIEADVNSDGEVIRTRVIHNTTGSTSLANQNADALHSAKFHPIMQKGERTPFKYYHRVTY